MNTPDKPRAVSAQVKYANTPESDVQTRVMHVVTMSDGTTRELMATDPMDALRIVNGGKGAFGRSPPYKFY